MIGAAETLMGVMEALRGVENAPAGAIIIGWPDRHGIYRAEVDLVAADGEVLDWEAVLGVDRFRAITRLLERWALQEGVDEAVAYWDGANAALSVYHGGEGRRDYILNPELPLPVKPPLYQNSGRYERSLRDRVEYALSRWRTWYRHEAHPSWRERFPEEPTLEGVQAFGLAHYWHPLEDEAAMRILQEMMEGGDAREQSDYE